MPCSFRRRRSAIAPPRPVAVQPSHRLPAANAPPSIVRPEWSATRVYVVRAFHLVSPCSGAQPCAMVRQFKTGGVYKCSIGIKDEELGASFLIKVVGLDRTRPWDRLHYRIFGNTFFGHPQASFKFFELISGTPACVRTAAIEAPRSAIMTSTRTLDVPAIMTSTQRWSACTFPKPMQLRHHLI